MTDDRTRRVRDAARGRWLDAGRPEGRDLEFWLAAEREAEAAEARAMLDAAASCGPATPRGVAAVGRHPAEWALLASLALLALTLIGLAAGLAVSLAAGAIR